MHTSRDQFFYANRCPHLERERKGAVVILFVILLPVLIAFIAFAVDYAIISVAKHELQNAADAGAMSTIVVLGKDPVNADIAAEEVLTANHLLGSPLQVNVTEDVTYGTWDEENRTFNEIPRVADAVPPGASAVRVRLLRTRATGNPIPLYFAPVIGTDNANVVAEAIATTSSPCSGFIGIDWIDLQNNATTDSYNSDDGPYNRWGSNRFENGDVCSNGPIDLASGFDVYGDARGNNVDIAHGSGVTISGSQGPMTSTLAFDAVDFSEADVNNNSTIERGPTWAPEFYNPNGNGDLIINNGRNITLAAGTYRFRDLMLAGGCKLSISGPVKIYIEREMRFDNGTTANFGQIPADMAIFVGDGPVNVQGGNNLYATIYAPEADVTLANGSGFFGGIVGKTLTIAGGNGSHYDESLGIEAGASGGSKMVK